MLTAQHEIKVLERILKIGCDCMQDKTRFCHEKCEYYRYVPDEYGGSYGCNLEILPTFNRDKEEIRNKILNRINELGHKPAYVNGDLRVINEPATLVELREKVKCFNGF